MCGIFGIIAPTDSKLPPEKLKSGVLKAFYESERRGKDSSGALYVSSSKMVLTKSQGRVRDLVKTNSFREMLKDSIQEYKDGETFAFFGHTRMATHGSVEVEENNQPVVSNNSVVLHNGIIVNQDEIFNTMPKLKRELDVDTEIIPLLVEHLQREGNDEKSSIILASKKIEGANTFVYLNSESDFAYLNSSNGSLYVVEDASTGLFIFASEKQTLSKILREFRFEFLDSSVRQPPIDTPVILSLTRGKSNESNGVDTESSRSRVESREIIKLESSLISRGQVSKSLPNYSGNSLPAEFYSKLPDFKDISRCKKCILPRNYPFLGFDESGICELCRNERSFPQKGINRLVSDLDVQSGSRYLIPISGGRDSCYALHFAVREMNLNVVAYTYDWGFVTDVARKNISRMCGDLGVEHILVAADLGMKRRNVQKNVSAWLKKPHLGMVPLFMAGDKDFFRFASEVKQELQLANSLFGMTRFEPAGFKTGFAGVSEKNQYEKTFDLGISNKIRLASFYAKQSVVNPRYLNSSLIDSVSGYYSYYLKKMDFLQLFDYVIWNEKTVLSTLFDGYGWETSTHSSNTWRIGDASAPFYNYLYFYFAGLTENDVYLSNLIRDGQVTRSEALRLVENFNQGDEIGFVAYCHLIGLDAKDVLKQIHMVPGLKNLGL